jgi:hypothetical protein
MKKKIVLVMMAGLVLTLLMSGVGQADVTLTGTNLKVGVSDSGGMVNYTTLQGVTYLPGTAGNDFTFPGIPWEYYAIGVNGVASTFGAPGYTPVNPAAFTTTAFLGSILQAVTTDGTFTVNGVVLGYTQTIWFDVNSQTINVSADILNTSDNSINVVYGRGMDPDQDAATFGNFATINYIVGGSVTAVGSNDSLFVTMKDNTDGVAGIASVSGPLGGTWVSDPYNLAAGGFLNGATVPGANEDASINMVWQFTLGAHQSKEIDFSYQLGQVPLPPSVLLLGSGLLGLGLVGWRRRKES